MIPLNTIHNVGENSQCFFQTVWPNWGRSSREILFWSPKSKNTGLSTFLLSAGEATHHKGNLVSGATPAHDRTSALRPPVPLYLWISETSLSFDVAKCRGKLQLSLKTSNKSRQRKLFDAAMQNLPNGMWVKSQRNKMDLWWDFMVLLQKH